MLAPISLPAILLSGVSVSSRMATATINSGLPQLQVSVLVTDCSLLLTLEA